MDTLSVLFYTFSAVLLFAGFKVITARNTVHSALYLVLAFFNASCIWMLLKAEFLAISLVLVYVGAVMVLFLFVVMMLDINVDAMRKGFWRAFPVAAAVGVLIVLEMAAVLTGGFRVAEEPKGLAEPVVAASSQVAGQTYPGVMNNTRELGITLYTQYLYALEVAAVLLLVAIIAAIALTLRRRKDSKYISPSDQVRVQKSDRLRVVSMQPEQNT
jgi:NADH-quinone oxidoreductase subunit J